MNGTTILRVARGVLAGEITFPEVVRDLLAAGVESYHVDYRTRTKTCYGANGEIATTSIPFEGLPPVAAEFDLAALRADLLDSQTKGQHFRAFTVRAMQAGVAGYTAFLRGQRVLYVGRLGDQHVEWFPGAGPRSTP